MRGAHSARAIFTRNTACRNLIDDVEGQDNLRELRRLRMTPLGHITLQLLHIELHHTDLT